MALYSDIFGCGIDQDFCVSVLVDIFRLRIIEAAVLILFQIIMAYLGTSS